MNHFSFLNRSFNTQYYDKKIRTVVATYSVSGITVIFGIFLCIKCDVG